MPWSAVIAEERLDFDDNLHLELAASWEKNQQSQTISTTALQKEAASRRMAAAEVFLPPREVVIERYGCQSLRSSYHSDSFGHSGYKINMIVTSDDCADTTVPESPDKTRTPWPVPKQSGRQQTPAPIPGNYYQYNYHRQGNKPTKGEQQQSH